MKRVDVDDVEPGAVGGDADRRGLSGPLGTTDVAINHYRLVTGERSSGFHAHLVQEEVFLVVEGAATIETLAGEVAVGPGEAIRFAPVEHHSGPIAPDSAVSVYALGAAPGTEEVRVPIARPECYHDARRPGAAEADGTPVLVCPDCGATEDATCPACGCVEMRAVRTEDGETPVGVCRECGAVSEP